ncbi:RNA-directed DNA polymerase, eukaryota [Tanacetum coccineum]
MGRGMREVECKPESRETMKTSGKSIVDWSVSPSHMLMLPVLNVQTKLYNTIGAISIQCAMVMNVFLGDIEVSHFSLVSEKRLPRLVTNGARLCYRWIILAPLFARKRLLQLNETTRIYIEKFKESVLLILGDESNMALKKFLNDGAQEYGCRVIHNGGSILDILDDMVRVGHSMGYNLDGCLKDMEPLLGSQGDEDRCKRQKMIVFLIDVKSLWGNSNFDFVASDSLGNSGGILCIWEASIFKKDGATISDNFIAIYGTWLPRNVKIAFGAVYAHSTQPGSKRALWDFLSNLVRRWNGEAIIMGDFNDVRTMDERLGSSFNASSARCFDRFIVSSGLVDVKLEVSSDFWPDSVSVYQSWLRMEGFDSMVEHAWLSFSHSDSNAMVRFKKKLQDLKSIIRLWVKDKKFHLHNAKNSLQNDLISIDKDLERGNVSDDILLNRMELNRRLQDIKLLEVKDLKRSQLSICGVYERALGVDELDRAVSRDEIRRAVWNCGENKSPGPDGYTFEFFRKYWSLVGADFCDAVDYFFKSGTFPRGCNSSFIALIPKVNDAKFVNDFRPISLIGCVYKVITKVLANRLATVISDLVSETQSAFVANRQILDGPFILNEMLNWCKRKKKQAMFFKVDFAKAYDSVRWDYLLDILHAFGFGPNWCRWIRGTFTSSMASILVNGSPTSEFPFCCGLKQGDPLAPYLFILIMESLHISFSRVVDDGLFKGFQLHGSVNISHLFYADDAMFIGEWSEQNLHNIVKVLNCFHLASGLKINIAKSQVLGVGVSQNVVVQAANRIGCAVLNTPFRYLGVTVGECMSRKSAWVGLVNKLQARLSKWKVKTLSIGGRLTLLKSVLGASPIYYMSIFKVPKGVLKTMESIRSKFFNGVDSSDRKISWVAWDNVLASKLNGGLGVSSFFALNRALLLKWVWRFISGDGSLWCKVIQAIYGSKFDLHVTDQPSIWCSILREVKSLKDSGFDFSSHCKKRIGDGSCTSFWYDIWLADAPLCVQFPRLFALELDKEIVVANKMGASSVSASFRRDVRDGAERQQWDDLSSIMNSVVLSSSKDRWTCDLSGDGEFKVKVIRNFIDDLFLPSSDVATRWVKFIPIKVNVFSWRARRDRLPTRVNLSRRGVLLDSHLCPLCNAAMEDVQHVFFRCDVARVVLRKICRWWDLDWQEICSFSDWDAWFLSFRLSSRHKSILEGVFYVAWWRIWRLRNQLVFDASPPNRSTIFDDIVSWSFLWCSSRCNRAFSWEYWLKNPYLISL